jgi:hypothetical protein
MNSTAVNQWHGRIVWFSMAHACNPRLSWYHDSSWQLGKAFFSGWAAVFRHSCSNHRNMQISSRCVTCILFAQHLKFAQGITMNRRWFAIHVCVCVQEDNLLPQMTVSEVLKLHAALTLPPGMLKQDTSVKPCHWLPFFLFSFYIEIGWSLLLP